MLRGTAQFVFRNFTRNLSFSVITLSSLIVGITTAILIFTWVKYEYTYDRGIIDHDRIFALLMHYEEEGEISTDESSPSSLIDFLSTEVPEVEAVSRIKNQSLMISVGNTSIQKTGVYGDSNFFAVYTPLDLAGDIINPLRLKESIAISKKLSRELFGDDNPIGKTVLVNQNTELMVSAVYEPYQPNSHFNYIHFVLPFHARTTDNDDWVNYNMKLRDASTAEAVTHKIDKKLAQLYPEDHFKSSLFPLTDWRLRWNFENGKPTGGYIVYVTIFALTGLCVLVMACVNYMNIATARAAKRAREIGVRKTSGATQSLLVRQFMMESFILIVIATGISLLLAYLLLPLFNELVNVPLSISLQDPFLIIGLLVIVLLTSLLAGSYPAFVLSAFQPSQVLKGNLSLKSGNGGFRKALVIFQFSISGVMIFCALIVWKQTDFLLNKDVGYDKHRVINVWVSQQLRPSFDALRERILGHTAIESAGFSGASPMEINGYAECNKVANPLPTPLPFFGANIDEHILNTLNFKVVQGRNFSSDFPSDSLNFVITEKAADLLGFENPIGQRITFNMFGPQEGEIIGVIKNFQNDDIHTEEKPVVFVLGKKEYIGNLLVRYQEGKLEVALAHIRATLQYLQPGVPPFITFLDSDFETQLHREKLVRKISIVFTLVAVSIACLGLFGLVLFQTQRRTKEIGIRKVLGASVQQVVFMLSRDFLVPIFYAFLFAFPVSYYLMEKFLEGYASRISIEITTAITVSGFLIILVLITAGYHSIKAARENPVEALKTE